jgi:glucokinase
MDSFFIGGLDIGGTKIAATVANADGPVIRLVAPTVKTGAARAVGDQAVALLEQACAQGGIESRALGALGVASCGPFTQVDGMLALATPNICGGKSGRADLPNDWEAIPLEAVLRERFNHIEIEIDVLAALAGERTFGAAKGEENCVYVTWSTGIGFGLCVDGHLLRGKHGNAGHGGHMLMDLHSDALCGCGNRGDLEALIAGRAIGQRAGMSTPELFAAAMAGDRTARPIVESAAAWLGRALYNLAVILDTRLFVIGGSVWQHHGAWLAPIALAEIESRMPALTRGVRIVPAALGAVTADVGALSLVMPPEWVSSWNRTQPWRKLAGEPAVD